MMNDIADRLARLSPEQRKLFEQRLLARRTQADQPSPDTQQPIASHGDKGPAPLSSAQQRLWFLDRFESDSIAYHIPMLLELHGQLDVAALGSALDEIVARHDALHTAFIEGEEGQPLQKVLPTSSDLLALVQVPALDGKPARASAFAIAREQARRELDLASGAVARFVLIELAEDEHWLLATFHHIAADGWSLDIFQRELSAAYVARSSDAPDTLAPPALQYLDYVHWQAKQLGAQALERQIDYWRERLAGAPALLELPTDHPRPAIQTYRGARQTVVFPTSLLQPVEALARTHNVTLFMVLLGALNVLLGRYSAQHDICIGTPIAGRSRTELESLVGICVNNLVMRTDLSGDPSFAELLARVRKVSLEAFSNQDVPFEKLVEELQPARTLSYAPLFQVMLVVQEAPHTQSKMGKVTVERSFLGIGTSRFDLTFFVYRRGDGLQVSVEYSAELFDDSTISRMIEQLGTLLESISSDSSVALSQLTVLPDAERVRLLYTLNETHRTFAGGACVHQLISAQAARTAQREAVRYNEDAISYAQLDRDSNRLARYLQGIGVKRGDFVGIHIERSLKMVIGLLGALKCGAAYVPLDPSFPPERLKFMLEDSGISVLLTELALQGSLASAGSRVVTLDGQWPAIAGESDGPVDAGVKPTDLAYILYTSGSTGLPKGVQIEHRALANFLFSMAREPGLGVDDTLVAVTTLSFDIAGLELYLPLLVGARVVLASREQAADSHRLAELLERCGATVLQATPATWRMLVDGGWNGTASGDASGLKALCGGESLSRDLAEALLSRTRELWNVYGPTETTIWSTAQRVRTGSGAVFVGRPIANTLIYILDEDGQPTPTGVPGELVIGGLGVARGYLNREELTAEKFLADPYSSSSGARMYRTGDRARYHHDGELEILGRIDLQVKVRGFRIELGEIESVLLTHAGVRDAVVVVREDTPGDKRLVGYLIAAEQAVPTPAELRAHLTAKLPEYMVPTAWSSLDAFPLTPNGKVDRLGLPPPEHASVDVGTQHMSPRDETETRLAEIWKDVLQVDRVGINDDFFDLGGHSLLAVRIFSRIEEQLGQRLPLATLFRHPTIAQLADSIRGGGEPDGWSCLVPIQPGTGGRPLFLIHAEGGEVLFYRKLASLLGSDIPVYGLQAVGLDGQQEPHATFEEMAAHYIEQIRSVQPHGPYLLGGHCYGGVIMFEMAQQLSAQGEKVAFMGMIDGSAPPLELSTPDKLIDACKALLRNPWGFVLYILLTDIPTRFRWRKLATQREAASRALDPTETVAVALQKVGNAIRAAYRRYEPKVYAGNIIYFMNSERARLRIEKWHRLAGAGYELRVFPGDPNSTFASPSIDVIADQVRETIDAVRTATD